MIRPGAVRSDRPLPRRARLLVIVTLAALPARTAFGWGADGHQTVATIAHQLLAGTRAAREVRAILGDVSLAAAAVWADCAKGIDPAGGFIYKDAGRRPECAPFETPSGEAAMAAFVKRNATGCRPRPTEEICHKQYHYADVSIQHADYSASYVGARSDDVTAAIQAAIAVLRGAAPPAPFSIASKREALLLLVHTVGDIHQPLHVGAVYLDPDGKIVNPDRGHFDPATDTRGGNAIAVSGSQANLHATWDAIPAPLKADNVDAKWLAEARAVAPTEGRLARWSSAWATDTQQQADKALAGLAFGPRSGDVWTTTLSSGYVKWMAAVKRAQLTKAGARLAQLLAALWPGPGR